MALDEFNWCPRPGVQPSLAPRVRRANFGDGYEQRQPDGINFMLKKYQLTFRNNRAESQLINDFLAERAGITSFLWTPPGTNQQGRYLCREWGSQLFYHYEDINCTFEEVAL